MIYTNEINDLMINVDELSKQFKIYKVKIKDKAYSKRIQFIKEEWKALSLCEYPSLGKEYKEYLVLTLFDQEKKKGQYIEMRALYKKDPYRLLQLFVRALPASAAIKENIGFEFDGFYYPIKVKSFLKTDLKYILTYHIDVDINRKLITIRGTTFSDLKIFKSYKNFNELKKKPIFKLSHFVGGLSKKKGQGSFIKKSPFPQKKQKYIALSIKEGGVCDWDDFVNTKANMFFKIQELLKNVYQKNMSYRLNYRRGDLYLFNEKTKSSFYQEIFCLLKNKIQLVDYVNNEASNKFKKMIDKKISLKENAPLKLLIVRSKNFYQNNPNMKDPYYQNRSIQQQYIVIEDNDLKTIKVDAVIKELLFKYEIYKKKFFLEKYQQLPAFELFLFKKIKTEEKEYPIEWMVSMKHKNNKISFYCTNNDDEIIEHTDLLDGLYLDELNTLPKMFLKFNNKVFRFDDLGELIALPDIQLVRERLELLTNIDTKKIPNNIVKNYFQKIGIEREIKHKSLSIQEFKNYYPTRVQSQTELTDDEKKLKQKICRENKNLISYLETKGYFIYSGLRKKTGYKCALNNFNGLFVSKCRTFYSSGGPENFNVKFEKFSRLKHIESNHPVPDFIFEMIQHYGVAHKQLTVFPFPFKHLNEYLNLKINQLPNTTLNEHKVP